jgi:hypothetical protein
MLPGVTVSMGGRDWIIPPLTLGALRRLGPHFDVLKVDRLVFDSEVVDALVAIATVAMRRNYPDLSEDVVADMLDLGNAGEVAMAIMTGSGLRRNSLGEVRAAPGDGTNSTASSPPPSATDLETSTS